MLKEIDWQYFPPSVNLLVGNLLISPKLRVKFRRISIELQIYDHFLKMYVFQIFSKRALRVALVHINRIPFSSAFRYTIDKLTPGTFKIYKSFVKFMTMYLRYRLRIKIKLKSFQEGF